MCYSKLLTIGDLVSGTECFKHTYNFLQDQSITRTLGNPNFKEYSYVPKKSPALIRLAKSLIESKKLRRLLPTEFSDQYILLNNDDKVNDASIIYWKATDLLQLLKTVSTMRSRSDQLPAPIPRIYLSLKS